MAWGVFPKKQRGYVQIPQLRQFWFGGKPKPSFEAPLTTSLNVVRNKGSGTPTFTRATTAYVEDFEGLLKPVLSGEARFKGARRVRNLIAASEADWSKGAGVVTTNLGGGEWEVDLTAAANGVGVIIQGTNVTGNSARASVSLMVPATSGDNSVDISEPAGSFFTTFTPTLTTAYRRYASAVFSGASSAYGIWIKKRSGGATVFRLKFPQTEDVTGQSNQNPSEYVSVGVLSAPYHGANVDGVKYFDYENGNTVASNVVTEARGAAISGATSKFGVQGGVSGDYFNTPNAAANQIGGDIDVRVYARLADWTGTNNDRFVNKRVGVTADSMYDFFIAASSIQAYFGATVGTKAATAATPFSNNTAGWVRFTRNATTGDVNFYTSQDGSTWTQLGATVAGAAGTITNNTQSVQVGALSNGANALNGRIYRAQIYNGIDGTLAVDFNPNTFASGTTWTSAGTGEVWTINGNAKVFGGSGTSSIAAPWDASEPFGYLAEGVRTNVLLQSQTLDNASWTVSNALDMNAVAADAYVAPDGTTTMDKLQPKATTAVHSLDQAFTYTAAVYTTSMWLRYVPATPQRWVALVMNDGTTTWAASFDLLNGVAGAVSNATSTITQHPLDANVYRVTVTKSAAAAAAAGTVKISLNATDTATIESAARAGTETLGAWGAQLEAAAFASTYIPTTTIAVARNADVLNYPLAGNASATIGSAYAEIKTVNPAVPVQRYFLSTEIDTRFLNLPASQASTSIWMYDGTTENNKTGLTDMSTGVRKRASSWSSAGMSITGDGAAPATAVFDGSMGAATTLVVGGDGNFSTQRNIKLYNRALSDSALQAMTT